jgi:hypothetical protein
MDRITNAQKNEEPIGIIISSGSRAEAEPRFSAYVWGPVPDETEMELLMAGSGSHRAA